MRILITLIAGLVVAAFGVTTAMAATVTVDATQATGGAIYQTLIEAIDGHDNGGWGDGDGTDTIEVNDAGINDVSTEVATHMDNRIGGGTGTLTIKNAAGTSPVIRITTDMYTVIKIRVGTVILDGLTFIGPDAADTSAWIVSGWTIADIQVRNCLVTANDGSGAPVTDWTATPTTGRIAHGFLIGEGGLEGDNSLVIEDSTVAHTWNEYAIYWTRALNANDPPFTAALTLKNVLVVANQYACRIRGTGHNFDVTIQDSAFLGNVNTGAFSFDDDVEVHTSTLVEDSLLIGMGRAPIEYSRPNAITLTLNRCTLYFDHNNDLIYGERATAGLGDISIADCIFAEGQDSAFRWRLEAGDEVAPASFSVATSAVIPADRDYRAGTPALVADQWDALNGGTGPIGDDPQWVDTWPSTQANGSIGWYAGTNTLYDVGNAAYQGKGSSFYNENALAGGGQPGQGVPVELSEFMVE
jgi:hypothetical protein